MSATESDLIAITQGSTAMSDRRARLSRLRAALQGGYPVPDDLAAWLLDGLGEFEAAGARRSLCRCLGLRAPGQVSIGYAAARQQRFWSLYRAYECSSGLKYSEPGNREISPTARCVYLAAAVRLVERAWPRLPNANGAAWRGEIYRVLAEALALEKAGGPRLPRTARRIYALLHDGDWPVFTSIGFKAHSRR